MKVNELKLLIKKMVKESLEEILLENYVEKMVVKAINENKNIISKPKTLREVMNISEENVEKEVINRKSEDNDMQIRQEKRKEILNKIFGNSISEGKKIESSNPYVKEIFEDTLNNMQEEDLQKNPVESLGSGISEDVLMKQFGLKPKR